MTFSSLPLSVFDFAFIGILTAGVLRGRKVGMSEELLKLIMWVTLVVVCAFAYEPLGRVFAQSATMFSLLSCYMMAYVACALGVVTVFVLVKRAFGGKLLGSDMFGSAEYYLGMGSGLVRFGCILIAGLALLNARSYDINEVREMEAYQNREYGRNYFPTLQTVQAMVFQRSISGAWLHDHLSFLFIKPTAPEKKEFKQKDYSFPS
jgi:hypothetical protein